MKRWVGPTIGLIAVVMLAAIILWPVGYAPKTIFDFDDGTMQSWGMGDGVFDDTGKEYKHPAGSLWLFKWHDYHQYPGNFPGTDHKGDQKGCFRFGNGGLELANIGFPSTSKYWQVEIVSANLTNLFKGTKRVEAYLGDMYSTGPAKISAVILLRVHTGGSSKILPGKNPAFTTVSKTAWTKVAADFDFPADAVVQKIIIRIRGDHPGLYEGAVFIDHVEAKK